jgi:predicted enzyme related to lactoylglutathione lyase
MGLTNRRVWVTIGVTDFGRVCQFYQQLFEQAPIAIMPNQYAEFAIADLRIGIYRSRLAEQATIAPSSLAQPFPPISLCIEVADLTAAINHLTQLGYPPPGEIITAPHGQEIYAYDPEGNRLILYQPINS